jgi:hypothetical protein
VFLWRIGSGRVGVMVSDVPPAIVLAREALYGIRTAGVGAFVGHGRK